MESALQIPCYYQLRFGADPDEAMAAVPNCCVWTQSGLTAVPNSRDSASAELAVRHVAGDLLKAGLSVISLLPVPDIVLAQQTMVAPFDFKLQRWLAFTAMLGLLPGSQVCPFYAYTSRQHSIYIHIGKTCETAALHSLKMWKDVLEFYLKE